MNVFVRLALLLSILCAFTGTAPAQQGPADDASEKITTAPTSTPPSPFPQLKRAPSKPVPRSVKIAIVATGLAIALVVFFFSLRAWRSSNLFDRHYRFPPIADVALRFGGTKSGGHMSTLRFGEEPQSAAKDS